MGGKVSVSIVEERDLASGIRTGGLFIAVGLVLGRAVAGDWVSESATLRDFFRHNRSISFTSDFPSSHFLAAHGIQRVLLIQKDRLEPQADLAHSLRRWQEGGLQLERVRLDGASTPEPFQVARPPWYGAMFQRILSSLGFRRAAGGGFGAWLPDASAGG